ncbi:phage tail protein [Ensifer aridi]|uniref:phage tail protein n=1 Tax=Ensifer aridi TaxID=1708715 RepID=UPI000A10AE0C|nr:phage tail protein [Ensifer aridi]
MRILPFLFWLAVLFLSAEIAFADPISAAIGAIAGLFQAGGFAAAFVKFAVGLAVQYGVSLIEKARAKKRQSQIEPRGVTLQVRVGDDQPAQFIVGTYATAGIRKYIGAWGQAGKTPNAYLTDVIELSCIPHPGLAGIWIDDTKGTILWDEPHADGRGYPIEEFRVDGGDFAWVRFVDGTQTVADPWLIGKFGGHAERPFKSTMIGRGVAYAVVTFRYNVEKFAGLPSCLFEMLPMPLYDLRKDSTNGGSGAQRWNDPSTWEPTDNNAIVDYNLIRGVYYGSEWVYGGQNLAAFRLPASNWIAAANECDRLVDKASGGQEKQFRCGYEIRLDMEPLSVIDDIRQGCNGRIAEVGGVFKMLVGAPGAAVYSFTDDDILVTKEQSFEPFPSLSETHNGIEATYPEPKEKWASKDAPARYSSTLEAADGNRRLVSSVEFPAVPFGRQVQALMKAMIEEERRFRMHLFHLPPDAFPLEPNDVVSWTSPRNGYESKKFLVIRIFGLLTFNQLVFLKEMDPTDYDWQGSDELPTEVGWLGPIEPPAQPMTGWSVEPDAIKDAAGGDRRPAIRVGCAADLDDVRSVRVQARVKATAAVVFDSDATRYESPYQWVISGAWCLPATTFEVRGKLIPNSTRVTEWSAWLEVTTYDIAITDVLVGLAEVRDDVRNRLAELQGEMDNVLRRSIEEILDTFSLEGAVGQVQRQELRAELGNALAQIIEERRVRASETEALAQSITILSAGIANNLARVIAEETARATADTALASSITGVSADVNGRFAEGLVKFEAVSAPTGVDARFSVMLRAGTSDSFKVSGFFVEIYTESGTQKSRMAIEADQFVVTDGNERHYPLVFSGGVLKLAIADIGTVNSGRLLALNGKMDINLNNGTIEIYS